MTVIVKFCIHDVRRTWIHSKHVTYMAIIKLSDEGCTSGPWSLYHDGDLLPPFLTLWLSSKTSRHTSSACILMSTLHSFLWKTKGDLVKACHTPPLKKAKKQGDYECHYPSSVPTLLNDMWLRMGNGIFPCLFAFWRGGIWQAITKSPLVFGENFLLHILGVNHSREGYMQWPFFVWCIK